MKASTKSSIIEWTLIVLVVTGITVYSLMDSLQNYERLILDEKTDSIKRARSIEILHKWHRTGYIDTTGTGQGVNTLDTNRY